MTDTSFLRQVSACQPYDALVSTPAGMIPIGRLVADDAVGVKVHDAHGTTRIVSTRANGVKEVVRLHTAAGPVLDVTPDHLVWRAADLAVGEFTVAGFLRPGDRMLHVDPDVGGSDRRMVEVRRVERRGRMEVYDIQTESGEYLSGHLRVHDCSPA
jgi:ribonucleoside-diphosphate reductase alpha chain